MVYLFLSILVICITIIGGIILHHKYSCKHNWEFKDEFKLIRNHNSTIKDFWFVYVCTKCKKHKTEKLNNL